MIANFVIVTDLLKTMRLYMEKNQYSESELATMLHNAGLRPSVQRISIFSLIANSRLHPSAEEIYSNLWHRFPSLSRTTVYNSLHALADCGLVRELEIESGNKRYDLAPQPEHGHFMCRRCGKIFDTELPHHIDMRKMKGFVLESVEVCYKGLCPECSEHNA